MIKSTFCSEHFAMGCKLCSGDPEPAQLSPVITGEGHTPEVTKLPESTGQPIIFQPVEKQSEESKAVLSVTDEYAKACDEFAEARTSVTNIELHIVKLEGIKVTLQADVVSKGKRKEELRKKVLETLGVNDGGEKES